MVLMVHGGLIAGERIVGLIKMVEDYFELSLRTQNLFTSLQEFVRKERGHQIVIGRIVALNEGNFDLSEKDCRGIREELRIVKGELVSVDELHSVHRRHAEMHSQLGVLKTKVERKFKNLKRVMKGWSIVVALVQRFGALYVEETVEEDGCLKSMRKCRSEFHLVEAMNLGIFIGCKEVETMRVFVDRFHAELSRTATNIEFGDSFALLVRLQDLRNRQPEFLKLLEDFERQTDVCNVRIGKARALVSQRLSS